MTEIAKEPGFGPQFSPQKQREKNRKNTADHRRLRCCGGGKQGVRAALDRNRELTRQGGEKGENLCRLDNQDMP